MLLYCKKCNNLINKTNETLKQGEVLEQKCQRCDTVNAFYIQYRAINDRNSVKLTNSGKYAKL